MIRIGIRPFSTYSSKWKVASTWLFVHFNASAGVLYVHSLVTIIV